MVIVIIYTKFGYISEKKVVTFSYSYVVVKVMFYVKFLKFSILFIYKFYGSLNPKITPLIFVLFICLTAMRKIKKQILAERPDLVLSICIIRIFHLKRF